MFGAIARRYDLLNSLLSAGRDRAWRRATARLLAERARRTPARLLDVCCGTGRLAAALWSAFPRARVVATDFTAEMVRLGRADLLPAIRLQLADTLHLPFRDRSFDAVTVAFGIRNTQDYRAALREMARVVRPGGQIAVLEFTLPRLPFVRALYLAYFTRVLPWIGRLVSGTATDAYDYLPRSVLAFATEAEMRAALEAAGCGEVQQIPLTLGIVTIHWGRVRETIAQAPGPNATCGDTNPA